MSCTVEVSKPIFAFQEGPNCLALLEGSPRWFWMAMMSSECHAAGPGCSGNAWHNLAMTLWHTLNYIDILILWQYDERCWNVVPRSKSDLKCGSLETTRSCGAHLSCWRLAASPWSSQCQRALSANRDRLRSCSKLFEAVLISAVPVVPGSVPVRLRFGYGLIHRYSSEAAGCVSRTSWASWASSVPGPIDPRGEWRSLAQNGMQKYAEMKHNGTQMNTGTKWIKMDQNATNEARYISLPYFRCPTFRAKAGCFQSKESGKYCVLLRKAAAYLVTNKGNIQVGALHGLALQLLPMLSLIMFWFVLICLFLVILCHFVCYLSCLWCVFVDFVVQVKNGSVVQMGDILATEPDAGASHLRHRTRPSAYRQTLWGQDMGVMSTKTSKPE